MSQYQKHTKNNKPMIYRNTGLPVYEKPIDLRLKNIKNDLVKNLDSSDKRWCMIQNDVKNIGFKYGGL